jgi:hypothetical protein
MTADRIVVPIKTIEDSLSSLRTAGARNAEGVVLWLGRRNGEFVDVVEAYVPEYTSERDYFRIPRESMAALLRYLNATSTFIAAQVHSHPKEAFHSVTDDKWAIVRHLGALSLVVPHFARRISIESFVTDIAAYSLNADNEWIELSTAERNEFIDVQ